MTDSSARPSPDGNNLPEPHGRPRVTLLAVNSYLVHAYWDFDTATLPEPAPPAMLRFYDVTEGASGNTFDVEVDLAARKSYVPLWSPGGSYYVELGWNGEDRFHPLAKSNIVETPRAWPVTEVEPPLMLAPLTSSPGESTAAETAAGATPPPAEPGDGRELAESIPEPETSAAAAAGSPPEAAPRSRMDAAETLRQRLEEVYVTQGVQFSIVPPAELPWQPAIVSELPVHPPSGPTETLMAPAPPATAAEPPAGAVEPPPCPPVVDAAGALRRRLEEIYALQGVQIQPVSSPETGALPPVEGAGVQRRRPEGIAAAADLPIPGTLSGAATASDPVRAAAPADLTAEAEERFEPGLSSDFRTAAPSGEPTV